MDHSPEQPSESPRVDRWNQQAWPPVTFGVPSGWQDTAREALAWLPVERRLPPNAPVLAGSHILAGVSRSGSGAHPWQVQLRRYDTAALATFVMDDPVRWSQGRSLIGDLDGEPAHRQVGGHRAVVLSYLCRLDDETFVFSEAWLDDPGGHYFVGSAPAVDQVAWRAALETMLSNVEQALVPASPPPSIPVPAAAPGPRAPGVRYRCPVQSHLPVTLENVTSQRPRMFVFGSSSMVAWAAVGIAAASMYGRTRAGAMEGRTVSVPADGEVIVMDDRIVLHLVAGTQAAGVSLRADLAARTFDLEIAFGLIRRFGVESAGVYLDVVGRGAIWLRTHDDLAMAQWLAHLTHGKTWQPPRTVEPTVHAPVVSWCQQDPRFTFGLPQGWAGAPPQALTDFASLFLPSVLRCGVLRDAGPVEAQVFVIDTGPASSQLERVDQESLGALLVDGMPTNDGLQAANLGGEPVLLLRGLAADDAGFADRCLGAVVHNGILFALWYGTVGGRPGDGSYEASLPQFLSMLASWHWYG
jgi:hypothetical protein